MKARLLVRPQPLLDESIYSWLARLSSANASRNKKRILELVDGLGVNKRIKALPKFDDTQLDALAELTATPVDRIREMIWYPGNWQDPHDEFDFKRQFIFTQRSRVCPSCLETKGYWRKIWQLLPMTCCPEHSVRLTTTCKCGLPIAIYSDSVLRCVCGRQYSKQPKVRPTDNEIKLAVNLSTVYGEEKHGTLTSRLYEVQFCLWFWYQSTRNHDDRLIKSWSHNRVLRGVKYISALIGSHDIDISPLMMRVVKSRVSKNSGFRGLLGDCHDYVQRMQESGYSAGLVESLTEFEEERWHGSMALNRARYGNASVLETRGEVAERELVSKSQLDRVISYEDIKTVECQRRLPRLYLLKQDKLINRTELENWITLEEVSKYLEISGFQTIQLVKANLIDGRKDKHDREWLISKKSFLGLLNDLRLGSDTNMAVRDGACLNVIQKYPGFTLSSTLLKCLAGEIHFSFGSKGCSIKRMIFSLVDLEALKRQEQGELLTASQVSNSLNVNINAVYYLVKKGFLTKSMRKCRNRDVYGFSVSDIELFSTQYCFNRDAKHFMFENDRLDLLHALKPVNARCKRRSKVRVYRRDDLERLIRTAEFELVERKSVSRLFSFKAAACYLGRSVGQLKSFVSKEWIIRYQSPGHHKSVGSSITFTLRDLDRLKMIIEGYPDLMPLRAVAKYLGCDRSHVRKQFIMSGYLEAKSIPQLSKELFCIKQHVYALGKLLRKTVTGPELAKILGVTRNTVYRWMKEGKLQPAVCPNDAGFGFYRYKKDYGIT